VDSSTPKTGDELVGIEAQPKARVPHVIDPSDSSTIRLDPNWREPSNEDLTPEDVDAEVRRIEADLRINAMKRGGEWDELRLKHGRGL
jgi:hypothetical protein